MSSYENGVSFSMVHPDLVNHCWDDASGFLERAAEESSGRYSVSSIRQEIDNGRQQLWILFEGEDKMIAALTTMVVSYPLKRVLSVAFCGSNDESNWYRNREIIIDSFRRWAVDRGCNGVEVVGRAGWERVLRPLGFSKTFTTLEARV